MANQTAADYGVYPPRQVQVGTNRMHANIITTISGIGIGQSDDVQHPAGLLRGVWRHQGLSAHRHDRQHRHP